MPETLPLIPAYGTNEWQVCYDRNFAAFACPRPGDQNGGGSNGDFLVTTRRVVIQIRRAAANSNRGAGKPRVPT
ncbi:hypothetical protein [Methylomonas sp. DH-1]|uniref:hypothetical protein n=1 Tax=Methylomonas sp. (strain DH-1) TaxID=1727196 RepID=UPI0012F6DA56|nr:hypothetical protein [Methylomonas sp. DH-1]